MAARVQIETRRLGRTKVEVTILGLGGATLGGVADVATTEAEAIVAHAAHIGIAYFDTAPQYGYGKSEHIVGDALRERGGWVLSTKVGRLLAPLAGPRPAGDVWHNPLPFTPVYDYSVAGITRSYEDSLQRLGLDHIDIVLLHDPDVYVRETGQPPAVLGEAIGEAYRALDALRSQGVVKAIGLGVNDTQPIFEAMRRGQWDCFLLAGRYTLLEQGPLHDLLPAVTLHGASVVVGGPFNSGILAGRDTWNYMAAPPAVRARVDGMARVCKDHGVPLAAAALQFPLAHPAVASTIPGPRSVSELGQVAALLGTPIPSGLWENLKSAGLIDAEAPVPAGRSP